MSFVALVTISTFPFRPVPTWFVNLLGLVRWRLSSWGLATSFARSTALVGIKGFLIMTVLTILSLFARLLDEVKVTRDLLLITRAGTSAL